MREFYRNDRTAFTILCLYMFLLGGWISLGVAAIGQHHRQYTWTTVEIANQCQITTRIPNSYYHPSGITPPEVRLFCLPQKTYPTAVSVADAFHINVDKIDRVGNYLYGAYHSRVGSNGKLGNYELLWRPVTRGWAVFTFGGSGQKVTTRGVNPTLKFFAQDVAGFVQQGTGVPPTGDSWQWTHKNH